MNESKVLWRVIELHEKQNACPTCGEQTNGSWSEGGLKWAICDDCMEKERQEAD